ncbi:MAG TPA: urocanate hydratase [Candidatus Krumholzibacteria bacterium]|nr:urocanate hydratase [Candidatus Krumholzibacteria bacterium]HPD72596.1 urocanate hydratase [Candidatus Krumholzibacteria bacterium]HRY40472.1 urocanate hydratase [Candidatus Krumholzibacteria bacterium]
MTDLSRSEFQAHIRRGIPATLPAAPPADPAVSRAPARPLLLTAAEKRLALHNALRYFPRQLHAALAPEFAAELAAHGRIYMHRFRPPYAMHARPIDAYPARTPQAAAIMLMIQNNLDPAIAQHPYELITYGGNGTVFQNWAQYLLAMRYLSEVTDRQTLVIYSGHPLGLFPSHPDAPRVVVTNGMVVPNHSSGDDYTRLAALGVTSYGQMTAGSYMYIGPQGIVHGTTITILGAGRLYLAGAGENPLAGKLYVTSGLGGMSGAQGKAAVIAGCVGVIAEINPAAAQKRHRQGWVDEIHADLDALLARIERAKKGREATALAYLGNVVDLWEALLRSDIEVELGSDQTSLHIPFTGGYYPVGMALAEANAMMTRDPAGFKDRVQASLRRQFSAIDRLARTRRLNFWDYGNAFLLECSRAGLDIARPGGGFVYPSYVEHIMGPLCFDYGFGPFRWVCTSGRAEDLAVSDRLAGDVIAELAAAAPPETRQQYLDNLRWIRQAGANRLVVGSQARILYSDEEGRRRIAEAFNRAIGAGEISAPIVLGRDHHDVSGTDSPYRETANVRDGSMFTADMAVQNCIGDSFRGATWVSLHNGGGVGWGEAINGGFGMLLDGTADAERRLHLMLNWDVNNGIARRAWARNAPAAFAIRRAMARDPLLAVTLPETADPALVDGAIDSAFA